MDELPARVTRRSFLRWTVVAGVGVTAAAAGAAGYAAALEPRWLVLEQVKVHVPGAPGSSRQGLPDTLGGLRVAHLSDLHLGPYTSRGEVRAAVKAANALSPDLTVVTGDYVLHSAEYAAPCAEELAALRAPLGVYAIPGNHDYWTDITEVTAQLRAAGLILLRNASHRLELDGGPLWLTGVDDVWEHHHDLPAALSGVPPDEPVLLLVHEPDFAEQAAQASHRIVLQLSGHSHGGQVHLPLLGRPILPWLGQKYPAGLQTVPGSALQVYTSRGVGVIAPPVRFNCRPEVALITLVGEPGEPVT